MLKHSELTWPAQRRPHRSTPPTSPDSPLLRVAVPLDGEWEPLDFLRAWSGPPIFLRPFKRPWVPVRWKSPDLGPTAQIWSGNLRTSDLLAILGPTCLAENGLFLTEGKGERGKEKGGKEGEDVPRCFPRGSGGRKGKERLFLWGSLNFGEYQSPYFGEYQFCLSKRAESSRVRHRQPSFRWPSPQGGLMRHVYLQTERRRRHRALGPLGGGGVGGRRYSASFL